MLRDFDDYEQSVIRFMAAQKGLTFDNLAESEMENLFLEFRDCEKWQRDYTVQHA